MALVKRKQEDENEKQLAIKRTKTDLVEVQQRYSSLLAPIMSLTGQKGTIHSNRFNPDGTLLASASFDKTIFLWNVYGECLNAAVLQGHKNAVFEADWSPDGAYVYSCSADKTVALWDVHTATRIRRFDGHSAIVASVSMSKTLADIYGAWNLIASASDDEKVKLWDNRTKACQRTITTNTPNTCIRFNVNGDGIYTAGVDNTIKYFDLRKLGNDTTPALVLSGHEDTVTGISVSHSGTHLVSVGMDETVRVWDIRPYYEGESRNVSTLFGIQHLDSEKAFLRCSWSPDGSKVASGSSDRFVTIWNTTTREVVYKLPGHKGTVHDVAFHPTEPIIASCSTDKVIYLGEIDPKA